MRESKEITIEGRLQFDLLQVNILKVSLVPLVTSIWLKPLVLAYITGYAKGLQA